MRALSLLLLLGACGGSAPTSQRTVARATGPKVVVVVVFDQLGDATLIRELTHLDPRGAIRRTLENGTYVASAEYAYAATLTAPGHAAIHSGAPPRESGIGSNRVLSQTRGRISSLDDGEHATFGRDDVFASPSILAAETVADVIQREHPSAIVASVAMKDRSAIATVGQHPDFCYWFDTRAGGFTTSTWYEEALRPWVVEWRDAHPYLEAVATPWEPESPDVLAARLGPDDRTGEGAYGWSATFPHAVVNDASQDAYLAHPGSVDHQIAFAEALIAHAGIGRDDVTDLLSLSVSVTDYVGHAFGPDSHEYADALFRSDRAVGLFLERLESEVGPIAVLITSDHGAAPLVERSREHGHDDAVRVVSEVELPLLRAHLDQALGAPSAAIGWVQPYVYLDPELPPQQRAEVLEAAKTFIAARPGVALVLDARAVGAAELPADEDAAIVARGIPRHPPGDLYVMTREWSPSVEELSVDHGTSHGTIWPYDRRVPVVFDSPTTPLRRVADTLPQCRVAGTIALLCGVSRPAHACEAIQ